MHEEVGDNTTDIFIQQWSLEDFSRNQHTNMVGINMAGL